MRFAEALGAVLALVVILSGAVTSHAASSFAAIEIRLVARAGGYGQAIAVEGSHRTLEVESEALLGPADFGRVGDVQWVEGKPGFNVELTPAGAQKLEQITSRSVGRILAIIVDGKILMAPKILDPVHAQGFLLTANTEAEARDLAAKVRQVVGSK